MKYSGEGPAEKFERFLISALGTERPAGNVSRFQLAQMDPQNALRPLIPDWPVPADPSEWDLSSIADDIATRGQEDANAFPGQVSRYTLLAFFGNEAQYGASSPPVMLRSEHDFSEMEHFGSEPATENGLVAKLMRHTEILFRSVIQTQAQQSAFSEMAIKRLSDQLVHHQHRELEVSKMLEKLHTNSHERKLSEDKAEHDQAMKDKLLEQFLPLLPVMAHSLSGKALPAPKMTSEAAMLQGLVGSLSQEQRLILMQTLTPTQLAILKKFEDLSDGTQPQVEH